MSERLATVADEFEITRGPMISGHSEALEVTYRLITGRSGRGWLIPDPEVPNMGGRIYVTNSEDWTKRGEGFGGGTIEMPMKEGGIFELRGGWHTNSGALFEDTDVDLSQRNLTFVVISRGLDYSQRRVDPQSGREYLATIMKDIVYMDPEGGLEGYFMRGKHLCVAMMNETGEAYFQYSGSNGGSSYGRMKPGDTVRDEDMW